MYVYDLTFRFRVDPLEYEFDFITYLSLLSGNNQTIYESMNVAGTDQVRVVRVCVPYQDSLEEKYYDAHTREAYDRLKEHLSEPIGVRFVGWDCSFSDECSTGAEAEDYVLRIHPYLRDLSPICCGHCGGHIPYYLLPTLSEETTKELTAWEVNYAAYDRLFTVSAIGEMSAHKMLSSVKSPLNQKGLAICRLLEAELNKPVYYYLYRFYGKQPGKCPICGGDWKTDAGSRFDYQCEHCKIVANKTVDQY